MKIMETIGLEAVIKKIIGYSKMRFHAFDMEIIEHENQFNETIFVARVMLMEEEQYLCPKCGQKCGKYDRPNSIKRWRSLDIGNHKFYVECAAPRCICPEHGVCVQRIPWAFPKSDYTQAFETRVAYMAAKSPTNLVSKLYRIKWGTVGNCVKRVKEYLKLDEVCLDKLKKIAIDETSYRKGHKYITVVQNLETSEIIWAHDGHGDDVLKIFFEHLTQEQRDGIEYVVADGARWITRQVERYCPNAVRGVDPSLLLGGKTIVSIFSLNTYLLIKKKRFSLLKNPENLTPNQQAHLDYLVKANPALYAAYLAKERLRLVFKQDNFKNACLALGRWLKWARKCDIAGFKALAEKIDRNRKFIIATLRYGLSTGKLEATNNVIKSIIRRSFGFRNIDNLIALVRLKCGGFDVSLPGRKPNKKQRLKEKQ
jgi:transposase